MLRYLRWFPLLKLSSTTEIILHSAEVFCGSVGPILIFSLHNISFKSSWKEFGGLHSRSFPISQIIKPILKLGCNTSWKKQFYVRKSNSSLSIYSIITWKHGPTYWIIQHANKMVKTIEQRNQKKNKANSLKDAIILFPRPCQNLTILLLSLFFFYFMRSVSMHMASALFSWATDLNNWIIVRRGLKIWFHFL